MDKFKTNFDLLEAQQQEFTNSGILLRNIFSIYARHPRLSIMFVLSFGLLNNTLFEFISYITITSEPDKQTLIQLSLLTALFVLILVWVYIRIRSIHKDLFVPKAIDQKKVLITVVSNNRTDFKQTPSYNTYKSLLYNDGGHASINSLQKVILIATEASKVRETAAALKDYIENSGRTVEIFTISIDGKSMLDIKNQIEMLFVKLQKDYKSYEIISDYTGGTKDISIALLKVSESELVTPIYLNDASNNNHSKYK